ncbi:MAG: heme exporter protein CcmD [Pseudomonadota bacterium]
MSHMAFVLLSYGVAASILGGLIAWLWLSARATSAELSRLEAQGVKRRSEA